MLLLKDCIIKNLIAIWCHYQIAHVGRGITSNQVGMSGVWVIGLSIVVRSMISECVWCRHLRGRFQQQKMADLPRDRMSEEARVTFCGTDIFGPFMVKYCCKEMKQYEALYTSLSSKAIHVKVT